MRKFRIPERCERCDVSYAQFRTGLTFSCVRALMFTGSTDPKDWRSKRRRGVLGMWHQIKASMWLSEHGGCSE